MNVQKFLILFIFIFAAILWQTPKEIPPQTLSVKLIDATAQLTYELPAGECDRTAIVLQDFQRTLGIIDDFEVKCQ